MTPAPLRPAARFTTAAASDAVPPGRAGRAGGAMVWLPWLCAPAFALLPIAGCGLAGTLAAPPPSPPAAPTARVATAPHRPLLPGPRDPRLVRIGAVMPTALPRR